MKPQRAPRLESRRAADFERELITRARTWLPSWSLDEGQADFGMALLKIAARFNSEVAERLDVAGEKMALGFLDWLGVQGAAARSARLPVVLKMTDSAREPVLAQQPVKLQVDVPDAETVTFETESDLQVIPGQLAAIVAADPAKDAYYLPPPGLSSLAPADQLPTAWKLKNFAAPKSKTLQLDPGLGLAPDMLIEIAGNQYKIVQAKDDLVTIDPEVPPGDGFDEGTPVAKVEAFRPFDGARNLQEHILYIGDPDVLNVEAEARIEVIGLQAPKEAAWEYWGKSEPEDPLDADPRWRGLEPEEVQAGPGPAPLILQKPKGSVETTAVGPVTGRWIRAKIDNTSRPVTTDGVKLRINPLPAGLEEPDAVTKKDWAVLLRPEVFVNSTSSPPDNFFPLGREPRMFDTLYIGNSEAFSKAGATAWVVFELGDSTFAALSALRGPPAPDGIVAGVGKDGALRALAFNSQTGGLTPYRNLETLQPPAAGAAAGSGVPKQLDTKSMWPVPIWSEATGNPLFHIAVWSGTNAWIWDETGSDQGKWREWGTVPTTGPQSADVDGLIYLPAGTAQPEMLVGLRGGRLSRTSVAGQTAQWTEIDTRDGGNPIEFATVAPILDASEAGYIGTSDLGLVGISTGKSLYQIDVGTGLCTPLITGGVDPGVRPAAGFDTSGDFAAVVAADGSPAQLITLDSAGALTLGITGPLVRAISVRYAAGALHFMAATNPGPATLIDIPRPDGGSFGEAFLTDLPSGFGAANGAPLIVGGYVLLPGSEAEVFVSEFNLADRIAQDTNVLPGLLLPVSGSPTLVTGDAVAMVGGGTPAKRLITNSGVTSGNETLYALDQPLPSAGSLPVAAYRTMSSSGLTGTFTANADEFQLPAADGETHEDMWLLIDGIFRRVVDFVDRVNNPGLITVDPQFATTDPTIGLYFRPIATAGIPASYLGLNPATTGNWDSGVLQRAPILFPALSEERRGRAFRTDAANRPILVLLDQPLVAAGAVRFVIDGATATWRQAFGDTSANPELAWEYWDGTSWLRLADISDTTDNLRKTGDVKFPVPEDLRPGEWGGKTSCWIRARLIGGDYGKEEVSVVTTPGPGTNESTQTVERKTDGVRPPYALHVGVAYAVTAEAAPQFLLTQDSGAVRDQSDANRTPGAMVEIFTPLAVTLGRFDAPAASASATGDCVPDCECKEGTASTSPNPRSEQAEGSESAAGPSTGGRRAIFLGFTSKLIGQPVHVLFLAAKEGSYDAISPLRIDALIGDRFSSIIAEDETRALGETGLLKMTFEVEPKKADLFGQPLAWLRIAPSVDSADWLPSIGGIYPNGVWAQSAETMTRELLGSSGGQPRLAVTLARPPLLEGSLELRVREPLGEEERKSLTDQNPDLVKNGIADLPGDWVLWKEVADPTDCGPRDRVYALDEATGTVRFGDGLHGMIPPVGVDSIVAFTYRRMEAAVGREVAANKVKARDELNLVTPVESVESVVAADRSAGGVAPESSQRVLQFAPAMLRHRGRAVSAKDFEDLVRQKSADVVQARCFVRNGRLRLVVVMRGSDPAPSNAQRRELRRMLLECGPASLAARGALAIAGPRVRKLRVQLVLGVATLDDAGDVAKEAKDRLVNRFSTEFGGDTGEGWPLGREPEEGDVAEALLDVPKLESILSIALLELDQAGAERPWPGAVKSSELVMLAAEDVRIGFDILEAVA
jgi:hypothetical protein